MAERPLQLFHVCSTVRWCHIFTSSFLEPPRKKNLTEAQKDLPASNPICAVAACAGATFLSVYLRRQALIL